MDGQCLCVPNIYQHQQVCFCPVSASCFSGIHSDVLCLCVFVSLEEFFFPPLCLFLCSAAAVWSNSHEWYPSPRLNSLCSFFWQDSAHLMIPANGTKQQRIHSLESQHLSRVLGASVVGQPAQTAHRQTVRWMTGGWR